MEFARLADTLAKYQARKSRNGSELQRLGDRNNRVSLRLSDETD